MTLRRKAQVFVNSLTNVLNQSIRHGIRISYRGHKSGVAGAVGYGLTRDDLIGRAIPVTLGKEPSCWLMLNQTLTLEKEGHLKTLRARRAVYAEDGEHALYSGMTSTGKPITPTRLPMSRLMPARTR